MNSKIKDKLDEPSYTQIIKGHNCRDDQRWARTLKTSYRGNVKEVIGLCNYRNLYFIQIKLIGDDVTVKFDWIKKSMLGRKYQSFDVANAPVRDNVLDQFRV